MTDVYVGELGESETQERAASGLEHLKPFLPGLESALEDSEVSMFGLQTENLAVEALGHILSGLQKGAVTIRDLAHRLLSRS